MNQNDTPRPDETRPAARTLSPVAARRQKQKEALLYTVRLALLIAVMMVLHFTGAAIPAFGTKISLVLIPIALGAMLLGPTAGAILGFIYGATVFVSLGVMHLDPMTGFMFDDAPVATALICILKTTAAGLAAGWVYRLLSKKNSLLAVFVAAALVPTVNTGIFILGCLCIMDTISGFLSFAELGFSPVYFIMIVCAGANYALELAVNLIFSPALERVIRLAPKRIRR